MHAHKLFGHKLFCRTHTGGAKTKSGQARRERGREDGFFLTSNIGYIKSILAVAPPRTLLRELIFTTLLRPLVGWWRDTPPPFLPLDAFGVSMIGWSRRIRNKVVIGPRDGFLGPAVALDGPESGVQLYSLFLHRTATIRSTVDSG